MRKSLMNLGIIGLIGIAAFQTAAGPAISAPTSADSQGSIELERQKLENERLKLEKEKLQFEMEKMKLQATQTAPQKEEKRSTKEDTGVYQADMAKKSEKLAKNKTTKDDHVVLDLVNSEIWHKGVRYNIHEWYILAEQNGWPTRRKLVARDPGAHARYLYTAYNLSLLKYEHMERGIFEITAPAKEGDLQFVTPEGISFKSTYGDVRNAFQNPYLSYEKEKRKKGTKTLRYKHKMAWNFDDRLEVILDKEDKIIKIRYGVLDER